MEPRAEPKFDRDFVHASSAPFFLDTNRAPRAEDRSSWTGPNQEFENRMESIFPSSANRNCRCQPFAPANAQELRLEEMRSHGMLFAHDLLEPRFWIASGLPTNRSFPPCLGEDRRFSPG